jgi:uncharacterized PurR-regulated membrane protein YhhQ (DUF165 family)
MFIIFPLLYIAVIVFSNISAYWFIPLPFDGVLTVADLTFGLVFTLRDAVHHVYRRRDIIYLFIFIALLCSTLALCILQEPLRIVLASGVGLAFSEALDTEMFHRLKRHWIIRILTSNAISVPFDSALFFLIAFAGILPNDMLLSLIVTATIVKYSMSIIALILVYPAFRRVFHLPPYSFLR